MALGAARDAQRVLTAELLSELRHTAQTQTEFLERLEGQVINHVLEVYSGVFDSTGKWTRDYGVAAGAVRVRNLGIAAHIIAVSSASDVGAGTPTVGTGVWLVPGGQADTIPLASRVVTLFGTAGDSFSVVAFTAGPRPVTG